MKKNSLVSAFLLISVFPASCLAQLPPPLLDPGSAGCVSCHEDSITVSEPFEICHQGNCDHPAGVNYEALALKNRGLVPADRLDQAIKLVDGRIGCLSCHIPYAAGSHEEAADSMLSIDNKGSALCMACHRK